MYVWLKIRRKTTKGCRDKKKKMNKVQVLSEMGLVPLSLVCLCPCSAPTVWIWSDDLTSTQAHESNAWEMGGKQQLLLLPPKLRAPPSCCQEILNRSKRLGPTNSFLDTHTHTHGDARERTWENWGFCFVSALFHSVEPLSALTRLVATARKTTPLGYGRVRWKLSVRVPHYHHLLYWDSRSILVIPTHPLRIMAITV